MLRSVTVFFSVIAVVFAQAGAQEHEGDYLYHVSTARAAPGKLEALLAWTAEVNASSFLIDAGVEKTLVMRHSQGDQWDLFFIGPMESWTAFYGRKATRKRDAGFQKHAELLARGAALIAFSEDHFAYGPPIDTIRNAYDHNGFYHIEMFMAAPGKSETLLQQRRMENAYLGATGQTANMIFRRAAGSDVDVFTIGFHENFEAFAKSSPPTAEAAEAAAKAAGFKNRADISFYLRSLISGHHDTLAVKVE